jgi:O-acetylserine/cysteine efflux transporter
MPANRITPKLIPFVKRPTHQQLGAITAISLFFGGLNFGLFYVGLGLGSGRMSAVSIRDIAVYISYVTN